MLPTLDALQRHVTAWRQAHWSKKSFQLTMLAVAAVVVWPAIVGAIYSVVVRSRLRSRRPALGLVSVMVISCAIAQGAWLQWVAGGVLSAQTSPQVAEEAPTAQPTAGAVAGARTGSTSSTMDAQVLNVISGSFLEVSIQDQMYQVQLIGISAPYAGSHSSPPACYGQESQRYLQGLIGNGRIQLSTDESVSDRNEFGVMLRYAIAADGSLINRQMLDAGMAKVNEDEGPYQQKVSFLGAQEAAKAAKRGIWDKCESATAEPTPTATPTSTPTPSETALTADDKNKVISPVVPTSAGPTPTTVKPPTGTPTPAATPTPTPSPTPTPTPSESPTPSP